MGLAGLLWYTRQAGQSAQQAQDLEKTDAQQRAMLDIGAGDRNFDSTADKLRKGDF